MSETDSTPASLNAPPKDRHEPRGRKPNDQLPPSRAREVQRAFRLRRAEHLAALEERINLLESENSQLRALLSLPEADRGRIGSGPTGRGKALKEGGVPMSERVRARKEARERERRAKGLPIDVDSSDNDSRHMRDSTTLSPRASSKAPLSANNNAASSSSALPLFGQPDSASFNYQLPMPFNITSPDTGFPDFAANPSLDSALFKNSGSTPNYASMFNMFDTPDQNGQGSNSHDQHAPRRSPLTPPIAQPQQPPSQMDLLTRLKACCHLSDSHVVNDPGLLIFATRLCQSFPCAFSGGHADSVGISDSENLMLEDSWKALKNQLDPVGEADGENRINTGRMAAELVIRAAQTRGPGYITCRYREGMSLRRIMVAQLIQGLGGSFE